MSFDGDLPENSRDTKTLWDAWSLDALFERWPASPIQRQQWRKLTEALSRELSSQGHWSAPAISPGLVQARVATALTLARLDGDRLHNSRILTLGAHTGMEVRILRDWGARAIGIESNASLVSIGRRLGVVPHSALLKAKAPSFLQKSHRMWDYIFCLAPAHFEFESWCAPIAKRLQADGKFVLLAYWRDIPLIDMTWLEECLEGTMGGRAWTRNELLAKI